MGYVFEASDSNEAAQLQCTAKREYGHDSDKALFGLFETHAH